MLRKKSPNGKYYFFRENVYTYFVDRLGRVRGDDPALPRHPLPPLVEQQVQVRSHQPQEGLNQQNFFKKDQTNRT